MNRTGSIGSLVGPEVTRIRFAGERSAAAHHRFDRGGDFKRLGHAASPSFAALGHFPGIRTDDADAVGAELREIALRCLRRPHVRVHRRSEQDRFVGREQHGGREIVGMAAGHFRDQIRGRRRDDDQIGVARQADMADIEFALRIEQVGVGAFTGERASRKRRNEMLRGGGENAAHANAAILQAADQIERFVGGNAATDDEQDAPRIRRDSGRLLTRALQRRLEMLKYLVTGLFGRLAQDDANLVFHRAALPRGAEPQQVLELVVELPDGETGHLSMLARK